MNKGLRAVGGWTLLLTLALALSVGATDAELYFSSDRKGENRVTSVQEGDQIWIAVYDPDEDIDCDVRDKVWTDVKVMDAKTGAHIVWKSYLNQEGDANADKRGEPDYEPYKGHYPGASAGWLGGDFLEETNASTGLFVSKRPFQIGTRVGFGREPREQSHIVGPYAETGGTVEPLDFEWGNYLYADGDGDDRGDDRIWVDESQAFVLATQVAGGNYIAFYPEEDAYLPPGVDEVLDLDEDYMFGRFENMDTLIGLYVDPDDPGDVALGLGKIVDTEATLTWGREVYRDANEAAKVTIVDPDENLNCDEVEFVPVFVLVNPGSWNPVSQDPDSGAPSPNNFCLLKRFGGVEDVAGKIGPGPLEWYNIYDSGLPAADFAALETDQPLVDGCYYLQYPKTGFDDDNVTTFDTSSNNGVTRVSFYAQETEPDSGTFELRLNSILKDLGFRSLDIRDVLVAYYVDPNDQDDFKLATAYIEQKKTSTTRFTDAERKDKDLFWLGRDPVYVEVVDSNANVESCCPEKVVVHICDPHEVDDSEWLVLDEVSSDSPVFFTNTGLALRSVWEALGVGVPGAHGGYQLELDNWELEGFNEDSVYVRYNDVVYAEDETGILGLGDIDTETAFPPWIVQDRVDNDVSFDLFEIGDTQVYDGEKIGMAFLDREGNRITGYANSDCVFIQVVDPDQDEDSYRRERIDGYWDGTANAGQNIPFGPMALRSLDCGEEVGDREHLVNDLLGQTNLFDNAAAGEQGDLPHLYVLNPRNGRWTALDLLETGTATGEFVSVICVDLVSQHRCVPSLDVRPGDTILAVYQDPSNHSDVAWISTKVAVGGGGEPGNGSTTTFVDATGTAVTSYADQDTAFVKVVDPSQSGATNLAGVVAIRASSFDLAPLVGASPGTFVTGPIVLAELGVGAGASITATYTDPKDPTDSSSDTISIVSAVLRVDRFLAKPSPFAVSTLFGYEGSGVAATFSVAVYDLAGHLVWAEETSNSAEVFWDGRDEDGRSLANGPYLFVAFATDGTNRFTDVGKVFIKR